MLNWLKRRVGCKNAARVGARKRFNRNLCSNWKIEKSACAFETWNNRASIETASELSEAGPEGREGMHHWICTVHSSTVVKHECSVHVSSHIPLVGFLVYHSVCTCVCNSRCTFHLVVVRCWRTHWHIFHTDGTAGWMSNTLYMFLEYTNIVFYVTRGPSFYCCHDLRMFGSTQFFVLVLRLLNIEIGQLPFQCFCF